MNCCRFWIDLGGWGLGDVCLLVWMVCFDCLFWDCVLGFFVLSYLVVGLWVVGFVFDYFDGFDVVCCVLVICCLYGLGYYARLGLVGVLLVVC